MVFSRLTGNTQAKTDGLDFRTMRGLEVIDFADSFAIGGEPLPPVV
jgi:hypothetical protein